MAVVIVKILRCNFLSLCAPAGVIGRWPVHAWNSSTHWPDIRGELSAVMNGVKQGEPQQSPERVVVKFVGRNHFFQSGRTIGRMPAHACVVRASLAGTKINATLLQRYQ